MKCKDRQYNAFYGIRLCLLCLELPRLTKKTLDLSNVKHMALTVHIRSIPEGFAPVVRLYSLHFISFLLLSYFPLGCVSYVCYCFEDFSFLSPAKHLPLTPCITYEK